MQLRSTRTDHNALNHPCLDIAFDLPLSRTAAQVILNVRYRHTVHSGNFFGDRFNIHCIRDIAAAPAKVHTCFLATHIFTTSSLFYTSSELFKELPVRYDIQVNSKFLRWKSKRKPEELAIMQYRDIIL